MMTYFDNEADKRWDWLEEEWRFDRKDLIRKLHESRNLRKWLWNEKGFGNGDGPSRVVTVLFIV